jgi:hypothetical protein
LCFHSDGQAQTLTKHRAIFPENRLKSFNRKEAVNGGKIHSGPAHVRLRRLPNPNGIERGSESKVSLRPWNVVLQENRMVAGCPRLPNPYFSNDRSLGGQGSSAIRSRQPSQAPLNMGRHVTDAISSSRVKKRAEDLSLAEGQKLAQASPREGVAEEFRQG